MSGAFNILEFGLLSQLTQQPRQPDAEPLQVALTAVPPDIIHKVRSIPLRPGTSELIFSQWWRKLRAIEQSTPHRASHSPCSHMRPLRGAGEPPDAFKKNTPCKICQALLAVLT
jgi:hypothetical protein